MIFENISDHNDSEEESDYNISKKLNDVHSQGM